MRKDHFSEESLKAAEALARLKYSESEEDQLRFSEAYDFSRCQRPDGSFYGTSGQCRKGSPAGEKAVEPKKSQGARPKAAIEADMKKLTGSGAMQQKGLAGVKARAEHAKLKAELAAAKAPKPAAKATVGSPKPEAVRAVRELKSQDAELRAKAKDMIADQKTRKAELDRLDRAFKAQEKAAKAEPTRENKERLKRVRTALIQQERFYNRGERELEKIGKARMALDKKMKRLQMTPAQRGEARRIESLIRKFG